MSPLGLHSVILTTKVALSISIFFLHNKNLSLAAISLSKPLETAFDISLSDIIFI